MSHFTRVRTQLRDLETVRRALEDLGYAVRDGAVRGHAGAEQEADIVVKVTATADVGFRREGEAIVMVGDFWANRLDRQSFLNRVAQRYAYLTVTDQAEAQGWAQVREEVQADGSIRLVMQRWA